MPRTRSYLEKDNPKLYWVRWKARFLSRELYRRELMGQTAVRSFIRHFGSGVPYIRRFTEEQALAFIHWADPIVRGKVPSPVSPPGRLLEVAKIEMRLPPTPRGHAPFVSWGNQTRVRWALRLLWRRAQETGVNRKQAYGLIETFFGARVRVGHLDAKQCEFVIRWVEGYFRELRGGLLDDAVDESTVRA